MSIGHKVDAFYGGTLRLRVCGLLYTPQGLLLARHAGVGERGYMWAPPGGGVEFGEPLADALIREFAEETGLAIRVGKLATVHEHIKPPLHAVELHYYVYADDLAPLALGSDPELPDVLADLRFFTTDDLHALPLDTVHAVARAL